MGKWLFKLARNTRGATAVEYGLILSLIVLAMVGALATLGTTTAETWDGVSDDVVNAG